MYNSTKNVSASIPIKSTIDHKEEVATYLKRNSLSFERSTNRSIPSSKGFVFISA